MTVRTRAPWLLAIVACLPALAPAQPPGSADVQVGRYSAVMATPLAEQVDLLRAVVTVSFPRPQIHTVGDALQHLLAQSGYRLAAAYASDPAQAILASRPLPEVQRRLGPCTLADALTTLAGPVYRLVVDPAHRLVSFELTDKYRALVTGAAPPTEVKADASLRR